VLIQAPQPPAIEGLWVRTRSGRGSNRYDTQAGVRERAATGAAANLPRNRGRVSRQVMSDASSVSTLPWPASNTM